MSTTISDSAQTPETGTARVKRGMAEQLKGGVIMDVVTPEQAKIAEDAAPSPSWPWSGSRPTSARTAAWPACPTRT